jgi:hypothetical protein
MARAGGHHDARGAEYCNCMDLYILHAMRDWIFI